VKNKKLDLLKQNWQEAKILILGFAREGQDSFKFLRRLFPDKILAIADQNDKIISSNSRITQKIIKDKNIKLHLGKNYLQSLKEYDIVIKSPGIPPKIINSYFRNGQKITSQTEIFFENCPGIIIGITGTKGKSTTSSLIYNILKEGYKKAHLVGNIGKPVLNLLFSATKNDIYVYELSCHQLYNLKISPHIAVFLNIYPEHLDYYKNFEEYIAAKANITLHQKETDYLIYNTKNEIVNSIAKKSKAKKIPLYNYSQIIKKVGINKNPLIGKFNQLNIAAAIKVGEIFGLKSNLIKKGVETFKPLKHRLEFVGEFNKIKFFNDSLSTIPQSAIAAIESFGKDVETIILGGFDRGIDFKELADAINKSKIKNIVFFPPSGERIWQEIKKKSSKRYKILFTDDMKEAVIFAIENTSPGKICLLSNASPSFGIFKDYKERGNLFKYYLKKYQCKKSNQIF